MRLGPLRVHSTGVVSGLLFIGIGVVFQLTDGTANLGGLSGADTQFSWQEWIQSHLGGVSDLGVALAVVVVILVVVLGRVWSRSRHEDDDEPSPADPVGGVPDHRRGGR